MLLVPYLLAVSLTDAVTTALPSIWLLVVVLVAALALGHNDDDDLR